MKIDRIRIDIINEYNVVAGIMTRIEVRCNEKIYNYQQIFPEDYFESEFDRFINYAKEHILQMVRKEGV